MTWTLAHPRGRRARLTVAAVLILVLLAAVGESAASVPLRGASTCTETSVVTYGYVSPLPWLAEHPPR